MKKSGSYETDKKFFLKILRKEATGEVIRFIDQKYTEAEQQEILNSLVKEGWENNSNIDFAAYQRIRSKLAGSQFVDYRSIQIKNSLYFFSKVAAVFLVCLSVSYYLFYTYQPSDTNQETSPIKWITASTKFGEKRLIELPDHTKVHLNYNSSVTYPEIFNDSSRTIQFEGEAFFTVAHNESAPFIISAKNVEVTVLGTSFNFNTNLDQVALKQGKVKMAAYDSQVILDSGEKAEWLNGQLQKSAFNDLELFGWKEGQIYIDNLSLGEIKGLLEKWYGVEIVTDRHINMNRKFEGNLRNKTLANILNGLCFSLDCSFSINHKKIELYEKK